MKSFQIRSFDEYHNIFFSIWHIEFNADLDNTNWREGKCSCPAYQKNYICKHLIGLASRLKCLTIPDVAKNVEIGAKRKRGRPALARKALEYQTVQKTAESATTTPLKRPQEDNVVPPPKRSRGRPPKSLAPSVESTQSSKPLRSRVIQHMS